MYVPSEDSALLAACARQYRGRQALEIGVGSGIVAKSLEENFEIVAGSDIDFQALQYSKMHTGAMLVCCDAASAFSAKFDLIVSNPPYLPDDKVKDPTVHGGPAGIETTIRFIESAMPLLAPGGRVLVVVSSLADASLLDRLAAREKMQKKTIKEKRLFYETLSVIELSTS